MKPSEARGLGCMAPLSMSLVLISFSLLSDRITLIVAGGFYIVVMFLVFAVLNLLYETWLKQYDPMRDVFFFSFALAFTALGIFMAIRYYDPLNVYVGVAVGLIGGVLAFVYRPREVKRRLFEVSEIEINDIMQNVEEANAEIMATPLVMNQEKLIKHFNKNKLLWAKPKHIRLIYRPYYLVKVSVEAKKGIGKFQKLGIGKYDIEVLANAQNGGLYGVDDQIELNKIKVQKNLVIAPVYELKKTIERAEKFARTSIGPSKYRTVPTIIGSEGHLVYRPHWIVIFGDEDYVMIPADNQKMVEGRR